MCMCVYVPICAFEAIRTHQYYGKLNTYTETDINFSWLLIVMP